MGSLHIDLVREIPEGDEAPGDPDREFQQSPPEVQPTKLAA